MTITEQQKAAAFEWVESLGIKMPYEIGLTLLAILKPAPTSGEVAEAIEWIIKALASGEEIRHSRYLSDIIVAAQEAERLLVELEDCVKDCDILLTRIAELEKAQEWQTIDTAPRDGSVVILTGNEGEIYMAFWHKGFGEWLHAPDWHVSNPTHWLPIPQPPRIVQDKEGVS